MNLFFNLLIIFGSISTYSVIAAYVGRWRYYSQRAKYIDGRHSAYADLNSLLSRWKYNESLNAKFNSAGIGATWPISLLVLQLTKWSSLVTFFSKPAVKSKLELINEQVLRESKILALESENEILRKKYESML